MSTTTSVRFKRMAPFTARSSTVAIEDFAAGTFHVPRHETPSGVDDGDFDVELRGRLYLRTDSAQRRPLVIIGHGHWYPPDDIHSYQGYDWLGEHLAHHGAAVCSLDLSRVPYYRAASPPDVPAPGVQPRAATRAAQQR